MLTLKIEDLYELSKYTDILKSDIKVMTPSGLKKVYAVDITATNSLVYSIKCGKHELLCSPDHLIKSIGEWKKTKDFKINDIIDTKYGEYPVSEISLLNIKDDLLDIHVDGGEYYTNDILSHNSSILESFEFSLYGKVKSNKSKKWSKLATLPNRINGELLNTIKFTSGGVDVEVKRGLSPNKLELWENGVLNERAGKANIDSIIEKYVGMDIETFKSFISLSINDFKNFISLTNEEKQLLLDKLFNLEVINILNGILKDINKANKSRMLSLDSEIRTLEESIDSIQKSIDKAIERQKIQAKKAQEQEREDIQSQIDQILEFINSKKDDYKILKDKIEKIQGKESELSNELESEKKQYIIMGSDIKTVQREIDLYDSGKCPTCSTDFTSDTFVEMKDSLIAKKQSLVNIQLGIESNIKDLKAKASKLGEISDKTKSAFNDLTYLIRGKKTEVETLTKKKNENSQLTETNIPVIDIEEFNNTINDLEFKKKLSHDNMSICREKELYYKELNRIFSEDGVKKSIIAGIIKPINHFISENIKKMDIPFELKLDETFTAEIRSLGTVIEPDSLSTGEHKLANICILCSYLSLIRTKKNLNVLFLDEVFSSIDLDNIQKILILLKSFASDNNVNIFLIHHAVLNHEMFDRIIQINKDIFSTIEELYIS
jgi:DNA repair exonuclease SbcCD ATPase subunit